MVSKTNLAYNGNVLPQKSQEKIHIGRVKPKKAAKIKPFSAILLVLLTAGLLGFLISSMVRVNELTTDINLLEKEYKLQKSENVRLNAEIESKINYSNIEKYAKDKWGMQKQSSRQVNYITLTEGNTIELDAKDNSNTLDNIIDSINSIFS